MEKDGAVWAFSQNFTSEFRSARSDLEARLDAAKVSPATAPIQSLSVGIARLAKSLADAAGSLPAYDQRLYETVSDLEKKLDELRTAAAPKPKFAFKRKTGPTPTPVPRAVSITPSIVSASSPPSSPNSLISAHSYSYLTIESLTGPPPASDLTISDLDHCILNLLPASDHPELNISAIHLRKITNSVLLLPVIDGSVLVHDLSCCVIAIGCHQFRMHSSTKVDVFLSIMSNPIIEDCHDIRFAPYPQSLPQSEESEDIRRGPVTVKDFSHIRNTPSPHWVHMDHQDMTRQWPGGLELNRAGVEGSLREILPQ